MLDAPIDENVMNELRSLQQAAPGDFLVELFRVFLKSTDSKLVLLHEALGRNDAPAVFVLAHGLKSSCAGVGALRLSALLGTIEAKGRAADLTRLDQDIDALETEYGRVKTVLQGMIDSSSLPAGGPSS